jgi:hypothetical protein
MCVAKRRTLARSRNALNAKPSAVRNVNARSPSMSCSLAAGLSHRDPDFAPSPRDEFAFFSAGFEFLEEV